MLSELLAAALGELPADLVITNARIVNVFSGEIELADVAVFEGKIAGIGRDFTGLEEVDLEGAYLAPGLIDAHVHIESSLCLPPAFSEIVTKRGVTTVVADPHEIANVAGEAGVRYMREMSRLCRLHVELMAPSCVPATTMGTAGAELDVAALQRLRDDGVVRGLAEVMNFPGVIHDERTLHHKMHVYRGTPIDGHCPQLTGKQLNAYIAAGIGSDHESTTLAEAREKLARGLYILIREATNAHDLEALLPLINSKNARRICLCTDDRQPADLIDEGSVDHMLRRVIAAGIDPIDAFRLCTLNPAEWFGLHDRGAISPGRYADFFAFDDLSKPVAKKVWIWGDEIENRDEEILDVPGAVRGKCNFDLEGVSLSLGEDGLAEARPPVGGGVRVIGSVPNQLITESRIEVGASINVSRDVLKMAVVERHRGTGNVGLGLIQGIGLKRGAIAGTVAHDHHNLVVIGADDASMHAAIRRLHELGGGLCAADGSRILADLSLPVAGLMSDLPMADVRVKYDALLAAARLLGSPLHDPFMAMSFMALEVIPALKLTDQGLIDVTKFEKVPLIV